MKIVAGVCYGVLIGFLLGLAVSHFRFDSKRDVILKALEAEKSRYKQAVMLLEK